MNPHEEQAGGGKAAEALEQAGPETLRTNKHETVAEHPSAMRERFNWIAESIARALFSGVIIHESAVEKIRSLAAEGTVVYVLRHRSFIDYLMVNYVLRREKLPLAVFTNGVSSRVLAPFSSLLSQLRSGLWGLLRGWRGYHGVHGHDYCAEAVSQGRPVLIFMRGRRRAGLFRRVGASAAAPRVGTDYLREIVNAHASGHGEKFIVPLALFRGHSFRRRDPGVSGLAYSVHDVPSDRRKFLAYWWNRKELFITVGTEVRLGEFIKRYCDDPEERLIRRLARAIQIFLHREERVVLGPALVSRRKVADLVLNSEEMRKALQEIAERKGVSERKLHAEAEGYLREMAADFNGMGFAFIAYFFKKIWNRMFQGLEPIGFEKVVDKVKHHPIVLVPCHRSHFDYLILSYLFYSRFVSPPHIAAGINMAFWPMGPIFRAAGAFFIRRSFGDNEVYKLVFRQYQCFLIREGYTQEFFIEGGRSRTGKILTPKLGMLSVIVNAYLTGIRRDLYLVPVSIHYGRIVEEDAYQDELSGGEKESESFAALMRARRFLSQKYGTIYVSFADPISLSEELGERKQRFADNDSDAEVLEEKAKFIQKLGFRILKDVNEAEVAGATSVSATVLLGATHWASRYESFREQANALVELLRFQEIGMTASLRRNVGDFRESVDFLSSNGLVEVLTRGQDEVIVVQEHKRLALDFYKNNLIHAFLLPSLVVFCLAEDPSRERLVERVWWWLDLFRWEFPLPEKEELGGLI